MDPNGDNGGNNEVPLIVQNVAVHLVIWVNIYMFDLNTFFYPRPIPVNLAVNSIAVGFALKALEPASRLFLDFGASSLTNSGYALSAMIFVFMIIQVLLSCFMVRLNLENVNNIGRFKFLAFAMTLLASISLTLISTMTLMQEGNRFYLATPLKP